MREIKYRAWHKEEKRMFDLYSISFTHGQCGLENFGMELWERLVIMQFTGLKDENGKDLDWWEGDIIEFSYQHGFIGALETKEVIGKIVYVNGCFILESKDGYDNLSNVIDCWHEKLGNIHENLELLKD